jgi:hypothetical protein
MTDTWRASLAYQSDEAAIGVISAGNPVLEFCISIAQSQYLDTYRGVRRFRNERWMLGSRSGANVSRARNELVRQFLDLPHQPEWLFMVDDDMAWRSDAFEHLLASAAPDRIVGGLCFAYGSEGRIVPTIHIRNEFGQFGSIPEGWEIPDDSLLQVAGTGAAFLCVHREALEAIAKVEPEWARDAWFREEWFKVNNPEHDPEVPGSFPLAQHYMSEDLFFCMQAHRAGIGVWVNTSVEVKHCKPHWLTRGLYESDTSALEWA